MLDVHFIGGLQSTKFVYFYECNFEITSIVVHQKYLRERDEAYFIFRCIILIGTGYESIVFFTYRGQAHQSDSRRLHHHAMGFKQHDCQYLVIVQYPVYVYTTSTVPGVLVPVPCTLYKYY